MSETTGFSLAHLQALALLEFAETQGLTDVYQQVWILSLSGEIKAENAETEELKAFLAKISPDDLESTLLAFLEIAKVRMEALPVEIISAMPLSQEQLNNLQTKLIQMLRKQLDITTTIDASLLGGFRILVDNSVIDFSVKRKLLDVRQSIAEEVTRQ